MNLFKLDEHPMDGHFIIREYKVVRETPKYWFAQMRNIPNDMCMTFQIKKDTPGYFQSPDEAIQNFIEKQEHRITEAQRDIKNSTSLIERIKKDFDTR